MALTEIKTSGIADDAVTTDKLANAINTERTANTAKVSLGADSVTGAKIADDAIDSEHYTDGSIDTAHIADDAVTTDKLANAINTDIAAKAVLTGSTNNQITTVTGANAIQGEANLTFDGTDLATTGRIFGGGGDNTHASAGHDDLVLKTTGATGMTIVSGDTSNGTIAFADGTTGNSFYRGYFQYKHNTDVMDVGIGGGAIMEWTNANVKINDGDLVIGTAGHGIDFSANSHAGGMTSELLDSYEEGTWTPNLSTTASTTSHTQSVQFGAYTKIGNMVFCEFSVAWTAHTGAGNMMMRGLPFTSANDSNWTAAVNISTVTNFGYGSYDQVGIVEANSTNIYWKYHDTNGSHQIVIGATQQTGQVIGSFHYYT